MKKILMIKNLETEQDVIKLENYLSDTRLRFEINLQQKIVIIQGSSDEHRLAVLTIQKAGFEVL